MTKIKEITKSKNKINILNSTNDQASLGVSVHVLCYNHELCLRKCLDSILMQRTDFEFEILIHDDHSSDDSLLICLEYQNLYPNIIRVISEKNNIYSETNGVLEIEKKLTNLSNGKYIAICEGDDYWTDDSKLYRQFHSLESNPNICFCVHKVLVNNVNDGSCSFYPEKHFSSKIIKRKKFIKIINKNYSFQTSSYFFRTQDYLKFYEHIPLFARLMPTNDESWLLYFGSKSDVLYIDKTMSCYNKMLSTSWSGRSLLYDSIKKEEHRSCVIKALTEFNVYTNFRYKKSCEKRIFYNMLINFINRNDFKYIFKSKNLSKTFWNIDKKTFIKKWIKTYVFRK